MEFRWFSIQVVYHSQKQADDNRQKMEAQLVEMTDAISRGFAVQFAVPNGDALYVYLTRKIEG